MFTNYSAYISNGPELNSTFEAGEYELEGISAGGKATDAEEGSDLHDEQARDYDAFGMDFVWGLGSFKLRGEYIKTKIGAATEGITASPGATWEAWYTRLSYLIPQTWIEPVIRYGDFNSPHASQDQTQWGLGR